MKLLLLCCAVIQVVNLLGAFHIGLPVQRGIHNNVRTSFRGHRKRLSWSRLAHCSGGAANLLVDRAGDESCRLYGNANSFSFNFNNDKVSEPVATSEAAAKISDTLKNALIDAASSIRNTGINSDAVLPPITIEEFRAKYGTAKSIWGDWSPPATRKFYKDHLPRALLGKPYPAITMQVLILYL